MNAVNIETSNLRLVLQTPEIIRTQIGAMAPEEKAELSADWLALVSNATSADPWIHGFELIQRKSGAVVGNCGFKGPPTTDGIVEIAYGIDPDHEGNGYATEAAEALVSFAFGNQPVRTVRAHTLPEPNASTRVLVKCGFRKVDEVVDPDDGLVWRWERCDEP